MKKLFKYIILTCVMLSVFSVTSYAKKDVFDAPQSIGVNDFSSVISDETKKQINSANDILIERTESKIIFVTVPTTDGEDIDVYAKNMYNAWGVDSIGDSSSTFILMATDDMDYWAIVGSHLRSALDEETVTNFLLKNMEPDFAKKEFDTAVKKTFDAISMWYTGNYKITPITNADANFAENSDNEDKKKLTISAKVIVILIIAFIIALLIIRRKVKLYQISQKKRQRIQSYKRQLRKEIETRRR